MANKTKICKYCKSEIDSKAVVCPNCRKVPSSVGCGCATLIFVFTFVIVVALGSGGKSNRNPDSSDVSLDSTTSNTTIVTETSILETEAKSETMEETTNEPKSENDETTIAEEASAVEEIAETISEEENDSDTESGLNFSPEEITPLLETTLSASMPEDINSNVEYSNEDNAYIITIWQDGFANIVSTIIETGTNRDSWQNVVDSYVALCNSMKETVDTANSELDSKVIVSILNDQNLSNSLLTIENGVVTYDVLA